MVELELELLKFLQEHISGGLATIFKLISFLGEGIVVFFIVGILYYIINKDLGLNLLLVFADSHVINGVIKNIVKRPRPWVKDESIVCSYGNTATGYSFPSGHSQIISTELSLLSTKVKKTYFTIMSIVIILLVGFSRLAVRAHYPSDVIVGLVLGTLIGIFGIKIVEKIGTKKSFFVSTFAFLPLAVAFLILDDKDPINAQFADFYKTYGVVVFGYLGILFENKFVNFKIEGSLAKRIIRFVISIAIVGILYLGLSKLFGLIKGADYIMCLLAFARYGILTFVFIGFMPLLLKKFKL